MFFDIRQIKYVKNIFNTNNIQTLLHCAKIAHTMPATVGKIVNGKYTTDYNKWCTAEFVNYDDFTNLVSDIKSQIQNIVETKYDVKCLDSEIHFLHYKSGAYYKSHIDGQYLDGNLVKRGIDRDITSVVYLNDDYEGGETYFDFFNITVKPKQGDVLMYPTTFEYKHGVNTVVGDRYAIVFWFKTFPEINVDVEIDDINVLNVIKK